jgi:two-component system CheB/CheR fusion protein
MPAVERRAALSQLTLARTPSAVSGSSASRRAQPPVSTFRTVLDSTMSQAPSDFLVVGIGASAGGVEALREFFAHVPAASGCAYVVILHLLPDYDSRLDAVLRAVAAVPVTLVTEQARVEPDHVYVVPPNQHLTMTNGDIRVTPGTLPEERRAPVDLFFRTLADSHDSRAACVVLSGTGSDGSMGLKRVKERGGAVFVQHPREAAFAEMPRSAIATDFVDEVLPLAKIPARIATYRASLGAISIPVEPEQRPEEQQQALREIFTQLRLRTGHDFASYKRPTVLRRIERRITVRNQPDLPAYAAYLREHPDEIQALLKDLLISVTNFFRDAGAFAALEHEIMPRLFAGKGPDDQVRIWVVGCATGEEAYSIAMLCAEHTFDRLDAPSVQIFATDIDEAAITQARAGLYSLSDVADVSPERLRRFFTAERGQYRVRTELRELVLFASHNILSDPSFGHLDLISCRNLLIYLNGTAQERVLETFHFALNPEGYLFLGSADSADSASDLFATLGREHRIYQHRASAPHPRLLPTLLPEARVAPRITPPRSPVQIAEADQQARERINYGSLHQRLLELYAPPSMVISHTFAIVHLSDHAGRYLQFTGGEPSTNLLQVIRPELREELRTALYQAVQEQTNVDTPALPTHIDERTEQVTIRVRPVLQPADPARGALLVLFEPGPASTTDADLAVRPITEDAGVIRQLEKEVQRLHLQLRLSNEQYEAQTEELRASNEELQALNEELRSSSEELETSKEELQSINEELRTVNQELKIKVEEAILTSANLQNLVNSTDIGTIFLDRGLHIKLFTPAACRLFNLIPADHGRLLSDITHQLLDADVLSEAGQVLETLRPSEHEVRSSDGGVYVLRVLPYRIAEDRIGGVVLTFFDITARKRADEAVAADLAATRLLHNLSARLISEGDVQVLYNEILAAAISLTRADAGTVQLFDGATQGLVLLASQGFDEAMTAHFRRVDSRSGTPCGVALVTGERTTIDFDAPGQLDTDGSMALHLAAGYHTGQSTPLITRSGRPVGMLSTHWRARHRPSERELSFLGLLARQAADLIERVQVEATLRTTHERLSEILESISDAFYAVDAAWRLNYVNRKAEELWKRPREALLGTVLWDLFPNYQDTVVYQEHMRASRERRPVRFETYSPDLQIWVEMNIHPTADSGLTVYFRDITERKRAEVALRESEERFRLLVEGAHDYAMFLLNPENSITFWSVGAERIFGWAEREALGQEGSLIFTAEDRAAGAAEHELQTAQEKGSAIDRRWHVRKDGTRLFIDGVLIRLDDGQGRLRGFAKIGRDATTERRAEEALERAHNELEARVEERTAALKASNLARQELLGQMVKTQEEERLRIARDLHDQLGQQVTGLQLGLKRLEGQIKGAPGAALLPSLQNLALEIATEAHRLAMDLRPTALDDVGLAPALERMAADWGAQTQVRALFHSRGLDNGRLPLALETTLYRVVQEALTNVRKHAEAKNVSVLLEQRSDAVLAIVEDDGRGYDPDAAPAQLERPSLGLRGMRERVEQIGGALEIESSHGRGTTVFVRIPLGEDSHSG